MAFVLDKNTKEVKEREDNKVIEEEENLREEEEQIQSGKVWTKKEMEESSRKSEASQLGQRMGQSMIIII